MLQRTLFTLIILACFSHVANSQIVFDSSTFITNLVSLPTALAVCDVNNDGRVDIISASSFDDKVAWYPNTGFGVYGSQQIINNNAMGASDVQCIDLDGDNFEDVVYVSRFSGKLSWHKNLGAGAFGPEIVISSILSGPFSMFAIDMDNDNDNDILTASIFDDRISYFENLGGGTFAGGITVSVIARTATDVYAADLDGDGDNDVLSASFDDDKIAWYENFDGDSFGAVNIITQMADGAYRVIAHDMDGDGDQDVISASSNDDKIAVYLNNGNGNFAPAIVVTTSAMDVRNIAVAHINADTYPDLVSTSFQSDLTEWYPNNNNGTFGPAQVVSDLQDGPHALVVADIDNDLDQDVVVGAWQDSTIYWHKSPRPANCMAPDDLFVSFTSSVSATLMWTSQGDANQYVVTGGVLGGSPISIATSETSLTVTGLQPETGYYWTVSAICGVDVLPIPKVDTFFTRSPCTVPLNINTTAIGTDSAVFVWIPQDSNAIGYKVGIKEFTAPLSSAVIIDINQPANAFVQKFLSPCTVYQWRLLTLCGYEASPLGPVKTFITLGCNAKKSDEPTQLEEKSRIYPNPANDRIAVDCPIVPFRYKVIETGGKVLMEQTMVQHAGPDFSIDVSQLVPGMYFLILEFGDRNEVQPLTIQR